MKLINKINEITTKYDMKMVLAVIMLVMNQIFAFTGGTVFFKNIFHISYTGGFLLTFLFYVLVSYITFSLD